MAVTLRFSISRMKSPADSRMPRPSFLPASVSLIRLYWGSSSRKLLGWLEKLLPSPGTNVLRGFRLLLREVWLTRGSFDWRRCLQQTEHEEPILPLSCNRLQGTSRTGLNVYGGADSCLLYTALEVTVYTC